MKILIGCDPEFFVKKNGKHVSAYNLIEGTKDNPYPVTSGAVQVDGMALEFNINPANTCDSFVSNVQDVLTQIREMVDAEYEFDYSPVAHFGEEYIAEQPEDARRLGCDPDFNAYTGQPNDAPDASRGFRTASGHIHIGWTNDVDINDPDHIEACQMVTKQMDALLGLMSVILDGDNTRRELYGKAGAYRVKPYGVEYRVMSNFWLKSPELMNLIYNTAYEGTRALLEGRQFYRSRGKAIQKYINNGDFINAYGCLQAWGWTTPLLISAYEDRVRDAEETYYKRKKIELDYFKELVLK